MLATPNNNDIVFQDVPEQIQGRLRAAFKEAKARHGVKEAVVIATQDGDLNLQLDMGPGRASSLTERISRERPARDFRARVQRLITAA
jgi:hypothetical protein